MIQLIKHPVLSNFIVCLLLFLTASICFNNVYINDKEISFIVVSIILSLLNCKTSDKIISFICSLLTLILYIVFFDNYVFLLIGEILLAIYFVYRNKNNKFTYTISIILLSFLLHLFYIQQTPLNRRQHDLGGIILYIRMISESISNFNPWHMYYLFHQPLHFIISGYILDIASFFYSSYYTYIETLQFLSLFYVSASTVYFSLILRELRIKGLLFYSLLLLFAFNPTLTLFSGYISDDTPVFFWSTFVIYYTIKWYKTDILKYLCFAAVGIGIGTLTKISILMITPALSILFLHKLLASKYKKQIIFQLSIFIIIAVPIALIWITRNHVLYDMQFFNVPDTSPAGQNFRNLSLYERLFDFANITTIFISAPNIADNNILISLIKTELFGEWNLSEIANIVYTPSAILYILNIALKSFVFASCIYIITQFLLRKKISIFYIFFTLLYLTIYLYSIKYSIDFPYVCSSDYRLFAQVNIAELIILGYPFCNKKADKLLLVGAICYAFLSSFIYVAILL